MAATKNIKWKYKAVNCVDKKTWSETLIALRRWGLRTWRVSLFRTWRMTHTPRMWRSSRSRSPVDTREHQFIYRNVSRATWTYLTSRGGVRDGSVMHRRPLDNSTTTTMTTSTRHNHKGWRSGDSSPWMDHHPSGSRQGHPRYIGAVTTGGRGWPDHTPKGRSG